jgi:hypothetical protein
MAVSPAGWSSKRAELSSKGGPLDGLPPHPDAQAAELRPCASSPSATAPRASA